MLQSELHVFCCPFFRTLKETIVKYLRADQNLILILYIFRTTAKFTPSAIEENPKFIKYILTYGKSPKISPSMCKPLQL